MQHPILDMLKAYFKNETLEMDSSLETEIVSKAKEQALTPFLYVVYQKKEYKAYYISASIIQEGFIRMQQELTEKLNQAGIKHIYFKGSVLHKLYPDSTLRTRGDIDVLVDYDKLNEAKEIMLQSGYKVLGYEAQHHLEFERDGHVVEIHYSLFDHYRTLKLFKKPFSLAVKKEAYLYEFTNENHFIFCLHHFAFHLIKGAGLRYILDFYYMLKEWDMDMNLLHSSIEEIGYTRLYHHILNTIYFLSGEELDVFPKEDPEFFISYLLKSGIHGNGAENKKERGFGMKNFKFKAILGGTFLTDKSYRIAKYPHLGKHWFTYPLCLIHRIIYLIFTQTGKLFKLLFSKKNKISKEEKELYQKLGIDGNIL